MELKKLTIDKPSTILDQLLSLGFNKNYANKIIQNKDVKLNGMRIKHNQELARGDLLEVYFLPDKLNENETKIDIIYQDDNIIIANKPFGIEVEGNDGLCAKLNALAVHRLDRNTTGLIILAKNQTAQNILTDAIKKRTITKKYYAEVVCKADYKNYTFNAYLLKDTKESRVKIFDKKVNGGAKISTIFDTIKSSVQSSLIECTLLTGKTHQIRASLAFLKHPIIGDGKYGRNEDNKRFNEKRQRLHSHYLKFSALPAPLTYLSGKEFTSNPPWFITK